MLYIILAILFGIVLVLGLLGLMASKPQEMTQAEYDALGTVEKQAYSKRAKENKALRRGSFALVAAMGFILALLTVVCSYNSIPSGKVGIIKGPGGSILRSQPGDGTTFLWPWESAEVVSYRDQKYDYKLSAGSSETMDVYATGTLNYNLNPQKIADLYKTAGPKWFDILVKPRLEQIPKEETVKFSAVKVAPNRAVIRKAVKEKLAEELAPRGIIITDYFITDIDFPDSFKDSIVQKQVATQEALRAQQLVEKTRYEAESKVAETRGVADATVIQAKADAEKTLIQAEADAKKNRLIAQSVTPTLVEWQKAQALATANTIYVPSQWQAYGSVPNTGK